MENNSQGKRSLKIYSIMHASRVTTTANYPQTISLLLNRLN